jgi:hypothetical protein
MIMILPIAPVLFLMLSLIEVEFTKGVKKTFRKTKKPLLKTQVVKRKFTEMDPLQDLGYITEQKPSLDALRKATKYSYIYRKE